MAQKKIGNHTYNRLTSDLDASLWHARNKDASAVAAPARAMMHPSHSLTILPDDDARPDSVEPNLPPLRPQP